MWNSAGTRSERAPMNRQTYRFAPSGLNIGTRREFMTLS